MKFSVPTGIPGNGFKSRLGKIYELQRLSHVELETPLLLLRTKGGSVSHLTREVLQKITDKTEALQIPLSNSARCYNGVKGYSGNISEFVGLKESISYCTMHDPVISTLQGLNTRAGVTMETVNGRVEVNSERFMDMIEAFRPDIYELMSDSDNDAKSSNRRLEKSVGNSSQFLTKCLHRHTHSKVLQNSAALALIEGGYNKLLREICVKNVSEHNDVLDGYVISGLHTNGDEVENMLLQSVAPIINHTLSLLPENKLRVIHGCWRPEIVVGLIELGIDVFDSSLVDLVTNRYCAFIFHWEAVQRSLDDEVLVNGDITIDKIKDESNSTYKMEISLTDESYFDDFSPVLEGCTCLTCKNHTKAYVHHLHNTKELLGSVLLMIHNLHHYLEFFRFIRSSIRKGLSVKVI